MGCEVRWYHGAAPSFHEDRAAFCVCSDKEGVGSVLNGAQILERLSPAGLILLITGALMGYLADHIAGRLSQQHTARLALAVRLAGLAFAVIGTLILLDFI